MKVRRDAWSHEDDLLLAQTTLRHIRDGSTQVAAFDEVGDQLNRTSAACGYRWNTEVRPRYVDAIKNAKKQRKEKKRRADQTQQQSSKAQVIDKKTLTPEIEQNETLCSISQQTLTLEDCIAFLSTYSVKGSPELREENDKLIRVNNRLKIEKQELTLKYQQLIEKRKKLIDEYSLLMNVMNQASKIEEKEDRNMFIN